MRKILFFYPFILAAVTAVSLLAAVYYYRQLSEFELNPDKIVKKQTADLVAQVSQLMVLPENEEPVVGTVDDPEQLRNLPFFSRSQRGDKLLMYPNNAKAILYREEDRKIIDVAPLNINPGGGQAPAAARAASPLPQSPPASPSPSSPSAPAASSGATDSKKLKP